MFIGAYPIDTAFLSSELVSLAQAMPKFRHWHDLLERVCNDQRVQLALRHDLAPPTGQALWRGAPALPAHVTVCLAVTRHLMGWGYRTVAEQVNLSGGWRWVCQLYGEPMPNFRTLQNREARLKPKTLRLINTVSVQLGQKLGVTQAQKLRVDGAVPETDIHYPTDSSLLDDSARVLSRLVRRAREVLQPRTSADKAWFRDRHRQAHHLAREIASLARQQPKNTPKSSLKLYVRLHPMPIDPSEYPPDWPDISQRIRERDGHCCKFCGLAQHATGWRDQRGKFYELAEAQAAPAGEKVVRIVLTVAHLDHDTGNNDDANLAALCQRCHLRHERKQHRATIGKRQHGRRRLSGQLELL